MFYDHMKKICTEHGTTPTAVMKKLGLSTSKITAWSKGSVPNLEIASKIADYFGVSLQSLLGKAEHLQETVQEENTMYLLGSSGRRDKIVLSEAEAKKARDVLKALFPEKFSDE